MSFAGAFPGFKLRLTRWGGLYITGCVVLGLAAVNTGNNALMSMLAMALASYIVAGTWSRQVLASVNVSVSLPNEIFAGRPTFCEVELSNRSRFFPAYGLVLRAADGTTLLAEKLVGTGEICRRSVELVFDRRGWAPVGPWRLEVLLPLGFFLKSKELLPEQRVLVLPRRSNSRAAAALGPRISSPIAGARARSASSATIAMAMTTASSTGNKPLASNDPSWLIGNTRPRVPSTWCSTRGRRIRMIRTRESVSSTR